MEKNYTWKSKRVMKCISVFMSVVIFSFLIAPVKVSAETSITDDGVVRSYTLFGDLNSDNNVDSLDYAKMKMILLGTTSQHTVNIKAADLNGDGDVNSLDLAIMGKFMTGEIRTFPVETKYPSTGDNSTMYPFLNDNFQIALEENGSTGYQWDYVISDVAAATLVSEDSYCFTPNAVGTPVQKVWTFKALMPGKYTIEFTYTQPWETDAEPLKTVKCDLYVSTVNGTVINVNQGDTFKIAMIGGGIAGYSWKYTIPEEMPFTLLSKEILDEHPNSADSMYLIVWTFTAVKPGSHNLVFIGTPFSQKVECQINVV
ncbi:protease inhibitor I42 family protein [Ruminiclostridium papyrosolvens]|uniref:cellulase n=1 Tax=Ruminiclostridium papyrosolvens C7 TaxID=1330534 RepID=U4R5T3_9FIRM|nr:protease inhibitor I42 family protein [Ruminiclostridium papyrosolvens]EPR13277.1 hypothetical protein L323_05175 [Ruminiclostridium papyrosolvens C7]